MCRGCSIFIFFFFNDTATTEIYTLSLHDALPISEHPWLWSAAGGAVLAVSAFEEVLPRQVFTMTAWQAQGETARSGEHTSELQSRQYLVCRLLLGKKKQHRNKHDNHTTLTT